MEVNFGTLRTSRSLGRRDSTDSEDSIGMFEISRRTEFGIRISESRRNRIELTFIQSPKTNFHFNRMGDAINKVYHRKSRQQGKSPLQSHHGLTSECVSMEWVFAV
jgi:hypothetical protein